MLLTRTFDRVLCIKCLFVLHYAGITHVMIDDAHWRHQEYICRT